METSPVARLAESLDELIATSEEFEGAQSEWTPLARSVMLLLIAGVSLEDEELGVQEIPLAAIEALVDWSGDSFREEMGRRYEEVAAAEIRIRREGYYGVYKLLTSAVYDGKQGVLIAKFTPDIPPLIWELKERLEERGAAEAFEESPWVWR